MAGNAGPSGHGSAAPDPSFTGLCQAYLQVSEHASERGNALDSPAFQSLIAAAGGRDSVEQYCLTLASQHPGNKPESPGNASGAQGNKPESPGNKPAAPGVKPAPPDAKPAPPDAKPAPPSNKPTAPGVKPAPPGNKPTAHPTPNPRGNSSRK
jgi:hypothetical protein